jgi:acyl-CoA synthetase (NDP forming)
VPDAVGGIVLRNTLTGGFRGALYPVNPRHDRACRARSAWPSVAAIGAPVDLAVVATPAGTVPDVLEDCGLHGVPAAVVISAGFGGGRARPAQRSSSVVLEVARRYGIRLVGPNCLGVMRPPSASTRPSTVAARVPVRSPSSRSRVPVYRHPRLGAGQRGGLLQCGLHGFLDRRRFRRDP